VQAPELVMQLYDEKSDIWSVGMLVYQLLTGAWFIVCGSRCAVGACASLLWPLLLAWRCSSIGHWLFPHPLAAHSLHPATGRFPFWEDVRNESLSDVWRAVMTEEINWRAPVCITRSQALAVFSRNLGGRWGLVRLGNTLL
jgi:calcium-dependent protein kinase